MNKESTQSKYIKQIRSYEIIDKYSKMSNIEHLKRKAQKKNKMKKESFALT